MKKLFILFAALCAFNSKAADLIVQESGPVGTYGSIGAAVTASVAGDRIIINNRAGMVPWNENITITKPLEFLSAAADTFFVVQGNYTITLATAGTVSIIGMKNISGGIYSGGNGPGGSRSIINVMGCMITGPINLDNSNLDCRISGNNAYGITYRFGKAIGNFLNSGTIFINSDATATNDTIFAIGNKGIAYLQGSSSSQFYFIANNSMNYTGFGGSGLHVNSAKNSSSSTNVILNNSVYSGANTHGIRFDIPTASKFDVLNNIVYCNSNTYSAFYLSAGNSVNLNISYNCCFSGQYTGVVNNGTNTGGFISLACSTILLAPYPNNGHPDPIYTDLDLTQNDVGPFGGSFSLDNYFSTQCSSFGGGKARVYYVNMPRRVVQGNTINVKGEAYDR